LNVFRRGGFSGGLGFPCFGIYMHNCCEMRHFGLGWLGLGWLELAWEDGKTGEVD
jgi:hypothetical protein